MSDRTCPNCGHSLLSLSTAEEVASCPGCGMFFERHRPSASRWPAVWKLAIFLCGPMALVVLMRLGQWLTRHDQGTLYRVLVEAHRVGVPLAWFGWPLVCAFLLAQKYAAVPDRWMSSLGLAVGGMIGSTVLMLISMLLQVIV